jgi:Fur family ferric uptake transcriptional regulator
MSTSHSDSHVDLKKAGLKVTGARIKILNLLATSGTVRHFRAEDIYKLLSESDADSGISLATIYRVLAQFEAAGLVIRHHFEGGQSFFELSDGSHHEHLVCVKCGIVQDFLDPEIESRQEAIAAQHGFILTDHYLHLYGICRACQK